MEDPGEDFTEREFAMLVEQALPAILHSDLVEREPRTLGQARPDFIARLPGGKTAIVEVSVVTPTTAVRIEKTIRQLKTYGALYVETHGGPPPDLILVLSGSLPPERMAQLLKAGIGSIIDGPTLRAAAPTLPWPGSVAGGPKRAYRPPVEGSAERALRRELDCVSAGRADWVAYQRVVRDILAITLSPPLEQPLDELRNLSGVNRRDVIFPNYANEGLWRFLREHYEAHYIVVDAKNYVGGVKKKDILQVANYLNAHGAGLFGMIVCRNAADRSAEVTRREQWVIYRKLVLVLNDEDLCTMLTLSAEGSDPGTVIRQKIEDFRIGF